jgi:hypothetical protein
MTTVQLWDVSERKNPELVGLWILKGVMLLQGKLVHGFTLL